MMHDDRRKQLTSYEGYTYYYHALNGNKAAGWKIEGHKGVYSTEAVVRKIIDTVVKK